MRKTFIHFILIALLSACSAPVSEKIQELNGYWEIEKVELPSGEIKEYKINSSIDFIQLSSDTTGIRLKLQPGLDGSYLTSGDRETFSVIKKDNTIILNYRTELDSWQEKLIKLNKDHFISLNEANLKYFYKRYETLAVTDTLIR